LGREKSVGATYGKYGGFFMHSLPFEVLDLYRNQFWDNKTDFFDLKIAMDLAGAFLVQTALTVLSSDFPNSVGESIPDISGHFCNFSCFFVFNSFDGVISFQ
jgi:hypothetical protein